MTESQHAKRCNARLMAGPKAEDLILAWAIGVIHLSYANPLTQILLSNLLSVERVFADRICFL